MRASDLFKSTKKQTVAEGENSYGYKVGQTVKLSNGKQGRVLDIFDDSIEVLLTNGRTITVDFRDAQVLDEAGLGDVRARMAASRNPAAKPAATAAQPAAAPVSPPAGVGTDYTPKVGDSVLWRHSDPRSKMMPMLGTVVAVAPGKVTLEIHSKRMIQDLGKNTIDLDLNHYTVQPSGMVAIGSDKPVATAEALDRLPRPDNWKPPVPNSRPRPAPQKQMEVGDIIGFTPQTHDYKSSGKVFKAEVLRMGPGRSEVQLKLLNPEDIAANGGRDTMKISFWGAKIQNPYVEKAQPAAGRVAPMGSEEVTEAKGLHKKVKIVKGPDASKIGWIRQVEHGQYKGAPKKYDVDIEGGGQANGLPGTALRLIKDEQGVAESAELNTMLKYAGMPVAESRVLDEADDWEEETGKFQRFVEYAKKTLMQERDPKRRIESANYLSKQENKFFGSPVSEPTEDTPFGSIRTGKAFTDLIKGIMDDIQGGRLHHEQQALAAAIWLEPEGKQFLKKAHDDFIKMIDHSRKEREQHAIALSGYQVTHFGGRVVGSVLKGGISNDPAAAMTPEIYGVLELAEQEILRKKGEREDEAERQRNIAMWNALPMPLKIAAAAAVGKTPAQLEKILFAKNEIEAVGGLDTSDFPNLQQNASDTEQPETKTKPVAEGAEQMTPNWAKYVLDQLYNSNGEVTLTDLFDEGIPGLYDMFMDTAQEHGLNTDDEFEDVQHELTLELEDLIKGGHDLDEGDKIGNMPADKFDAAMARLKHLAGAGPLKTTWDPQKRVYKNVPTAVQPKK